MSLLPNIEENEPKSPLDSGVQDYNEVFFDLFCLFVGKKGRRYTPADISAATGISINTIENYTQKISAPSFNNLIRLCGVLPFEFKSKFINLLGGNDLASDMRTDLADFFQACTEKAKKGQII